MNFYSIYSQSINTIIAVMIVLLVMWTIVAVCFQKHKKPWCVINAVLAVLSLAAILYITIIKREADSSHTMPFIRTIEHIRQQPELIREMVMNAFLFFPFGLTAPFALSSCLKNDEKGRKAVLITIASALLLSSSIELIQYLSNFGNCELSDIVMNTLGAAIGSVSYLVSCKLRR